MSALRVAYVCTDPGIPVFGTKGASVHVQAVLRELVRRGATVHLLTPRPGGAPPADLTGVVVHRLPQVPSGTAAVRERAARASDAEVGPLLDALAGDRPLDLVYERYALWGRSATAWAAATGTPSVLEVNAPLVDEQVRHRELADRAGAEAVARSALSAADAVVAVSDEVAAWARAAARRSSGVEVLPNGVDLDRVVPRGTRPAGPFTVGFVGTLKPWHGVDVLLEATALLARDDRDLRLLLVGDGPQAADLAAQADRLGVSGLVERTGALPPAEVPAVLHRMDVAVAPYPRLEDFYFSPLKVYEYLAAGLPVVASSIGQVPEALDHGRTGVLVEPGSAGELAAALAALRDDPDRRAQLGRRARERAVERHGWDRVVDRVLELARAGVPA